MKNNKIINKLILEEKASLISGKNFWETKEIDRLDIPSLFLADGPNGLRKQKKSADHLGLNESIKATCFPTSATQANSWNLDLIYKAADYLGKEAITQGVNVVLGPGTNIKRNPLGGRNFEYYSEDPYLSGKLAAAFIKGVQKNNVATSLKHFAANNQEFRRMSIDSVVDERALREIYLTPFEIAVKEGKTKTVMAAYNLVNGTYANENIHLIKDILREEWKFDGVIISDWGGLNNRVDSLLATAELEMPYSGGKTDQEVVEAVKNGTLNEKELDKAVDRLITLALDTKNTTKKANGTFDILKHHEIAKELAEESIVLLKNQDNILPLNRNKKIAIIGDFAKTPRFQGAGSSGVNPTKIDSFLESFKNESFDIVGYNKGFHRYGKKSSRLIRKSKILAKKSDIVLLFIGLDEYSETEGLDRSTIMLPKNQIKLIEELSKVNSNIVAVISSGSVIDTNFDKYVKGLIHGYLPGQAGSIAISNVLVGKVNPSGKLAETYPYSYEDVPTAKFFPGLKNTAEYKESIFVGYRYFNSKNHPVKYPFGYGLSYTDFIYSDINVSKEGVGFKVKNIGKLDGKEISQLYIGNISSKILRPSLELKGFSKIFIKAQQTKNVFIPFDEYTFRYFNTKTNKYEIEEADYQVYIGSSSDDIKLSGSIFIKGTTDVLPYNKFELPNYNNININGVDDLEFEKLLGRKLPNSDFTFIKKKRILVDYNTTVQQLRFAKGWSGRLFSWSIRLSYRFLRIIGKRKTANIIQMALYHNPMRNISRLTGGKITWGQLDGLILMFNGKFFKGLKVYMKNRKKKIK